MFTAKLLYWCDTLTTIKHIQFRYLKLPIGKVWMVLLSCDLSQLLLHDNYIPLPIHNSTPSPPTYAVVEIRKAPHKLQFSTHSVNYVRIYKDSPVELHAVIHWKSDRSQHGRPIASYGHLRLTVLSFPRGKIQCGFKKYIYIYFYLISLTFSKLR